MNSLWLRKSGFKSCVLFFNGWGMDENAVLHLNTNGYDVCMFNRYDQSFELGVDLSAYGQIYLVAWSLGVWAATRTLKNTDLLIEKSIAINGTEIPVSAEFGIRPLIFESTLKGLNERSIAKFNLLIFGRGQQIEGMQTYFSKISAEQKKDELKTIYSIIESENAYNRKWNKAIVSANDLIFTAKNQLHYWSAKTQIIEMELPHFVFNTFTSWHAIINL